MIELKPNVEAGPSQIKSTNEEWLDDVDFVAQEAKWRANQVPFLMEMGLTEEEALIRLSNDIKEALNRRQKHREHQKKIARGLPTLKASLFDIANRKKK